MPVDGLILLILMLAIAAGFVLGRRSKKIKNSLQSKQTFDQRCLSGLNQLLSDRSDEAVAILVDVLDVTPETMETHLALGALLRRKGEVAQAIAVHQQLLAVSGLDLTQRQYVQLELALNYVAAGLYDRAEAILLPLQGEAPIELKERCLLVLLDIYQYEGEWRKAIDVTGCITAKTVFGVGVRPLKSHYCCELAELARAKGDWRLFRSLLVEAASYDKLGLRSNWLLVEFDISQRRFIEAVKLIKRLVAEDATVLPLLGNALIECYVGLGRPLKIRRYIEQLLEGNVYTGHGAAFVLALARDIAIVDGTTAAQDFLLWQLKTHGGLSILAEMLSGVTCADSWDGMQESIVVINDALAAGVSYRCGSCGFSGNELHWLCPSCKKWSTFGWVDDSLAIKG